MRLAFSQAQTCWWSFGVPAMDKGGWADAGVGEKIGRGGEVLTTTSFDNIIIKSS